MPQQAHTRSTAVDKENDTMYPKSPPSTSAEPEINLTQVMETPNFGRDKDLKALLKT